MKRSFGIGDILYCSGWLMVFVFVILNIILTKGDYYKINAWPLVNGIILGLLVLGTGALFAYSLMKPEIMNVQYIFAGFLILLHIARFEVLMPYSVAHEGMPFYIFVGALLMGLGTYIAQQGVGSIVGGHGKKEK